MISRSNHQVLTCRTCNGQPSQAKPSQAKPSQAKPKYIVKSVNIAIPDFPGAAIKKGINGIPYLHRKVFLKEGPADPVFLYESGEAVQIPDAKGKKYKELIFVMLEDGEILMTRDVTWHHLLSGGQDVAAAGTIYRQIEEDGTISIVVTDKSGHYTPEPSYTKQFLLEMERRGLDLSLFKVDLVSLAPLPPRSAAEIMPYLEDRDHYMTRYLTKIAMDPSEPEINRIAAAFKLFLVSTTPVIFDLILWHGPSLLFDVMYSYDVDILRYDTNPILKFIKDNLEQFTPSHRTEAERILNGGALFRALIENAKLKSNRP